VNVQDAFNSFNVHSFIDTPQLRDRFVGTARIRAAYLGFAWTFGAPPKPSPPPPPPETDAEPIHGD
jgi:hypothetical protein